MKLKWTKRALQQLDKAIDYIAEDNPLAALAMAQRIYKATDILKQQPDIGRDGRVKHTKEWVIKKTAYLLAYSIENNTIYLLSLIHSKQHWPSEL